MIIFLVIGRVKIASLALIDLIAPYALRGNTFGPLHGALSILYVESIETSFSDEKTIITGIAKFGAPGDPSFDPQNGALSALSFDDPEHPANSEDRNAWFDIRDTNIRFRLVADGAVSPTIASAMASIAAASPSTQRQNVLNVLEALNDTAAETPANLGSGFIFDMLLTSVVLRLPFMHAAKLENDRRLVPVSSNNPREKDVEITLPRLMLRLAQGAQADAQMTLDLVSPAATGFSTPQDEDVFEFIRMEPEYALFGDNAEKAPFGLGFQSAVLDMSEGSTPPAILEKFGFDESWKGLYLPNFRLFFRPNGMEDLAFDLGARNFLVGSLPGEALEVSGDFLLDILNQGNDDLEISARFIGQPNNRIYDLYASDMPESLDEDAPRFAEAQVPDNSTMIVDVSGGLPPYEIEVVIDPDSTSPQRVTNQRVISINFGDETPRRIQIRARRQGTSDDAWRQLTVIANRLRQLPSSGNEDDDEEEQNGPQPNPSRNVNITFVSTEGTDAGRIVQDGKVSGGRIRLRFIPSNGGANLATTQWTVGGATRTGETITVETTNEDTTINVTARQPEQPGGGGFAYFRRDQPEDRAHTLSFGADVSQTSSQQALNDEESSSFDGSAPPVAAALRDRLTRIPAGSTLQIVGFASYDTPYTDENTSGEPRAGTVLRNYRLCFLRALALMNMINHAGSEFVGRFQFGLAAGAHGLSPIFPTPEKARQELKQDAEEIPVAWRERWTTQDPDNRRPFWRAVVDLNAANVAAATARGTVTREDTSASPSTDGEATSSSTDTAPEDPDPP